MNNQICTCILSPYFGTWRTLKIPNLASETYNKIFSVTRNFMCPSFFTNLNLKYLSIFFWCFVPSGNIPQGDGHGRRASTSPYPYTPSLLVQTPPSISNSFMHVLLYLILPSYNWPSPPPRTLSFTHIHLELFMIQFCFRYRSPIWHQNQALQERWWFSSYHQVSSREIDLVDESQDQGKDH